MDVDIDNYAVWMGTKLLSCECARGRREPSEIHDYECDERDRAEL